MHVSILRWNKLEKWPFAYFEFPGSLVWQIPIGNYIKPALSSDIFVGLVSLNVRAFGPEKLQEIRLARKIVPGQSAVQHATPQPQPSYQLPPAMSPHLQHVSASRPVVMPQPQIKIGKVSRSFIRNRASAQFLYLLFDIVARLPRLVWLLVFK